MIFSLIVWYMYILNCQLNSLFDSEMKVKQVTQVLKQDILTPKRGVLTTYSNEETQNKHKYIIINGSQGGICVQFERENKITLY